MRCVNCARTKPNILLTIDKPNYRHYSITQGFASCLLASPHSSRTYGPLPDRALTIWHLVAENSAYHMPTSKSGPWQKLVPIACRLSDHVTMAATTKSTQSEEKRMALSAKNQTGSHFTDFTAQMCVTLISPLTVHWACIVSGLLSVPLDSGCSTRGWCCGEGRGRGVFWSWALCFFCLISSIVLLR